MSDYKPSTEELRQVWGMFSEYGGLVDRPEETLIDERYAEFDGWLAVVKAEAWDEGAMASEALSCENPPCGVCEHCCKPLINPYRRES